MNKESRTLKLLSFFSASGAFSDVYRARDKRTGQNVAIKVAQKYADDNPMVRVHPGGGASMY